MLAFILRRILISIPLLILIALEMNVLVHLVPGDPTSVFINPEFPPEYTAQIKAQLGLDQPVWVQILRWFESLARFDFQRSFFHQRPVAEMILDALPNTVLLSGVSLILIFVIGTAVGVYSAVRQYSWKDQVLTVGALFFYSMPSFWLSLMLVLLAAVLVPSWPSSGMVGDEILLKQAAIEEALQMGMKPDVTIGVLERLLDLAKHLVLPAIALGVAPAAGVARYTRSAMLEVIRQDYIRTARAKGVPGRRVVLRHALRNALIPVITLLGLYLPFLISGAVLVEYIFAWPGMGRLIVEGVFQRDYPVILATGLLLAVVVVLGNLLADVLYSVVDPRIRYG